MKHVPSGIDLLSVPPIAKAVGTALALLAPGARVVAHDLGCPLPRSTHGWSSDLGCHLLRCGECSCFPFFTAPMTRA